MGRQGPHGWVIFRSAPTGLAFIALIPIATIKVLAFFNVTTLVAVLHDLESLLVIVDLGVFAAVFLSGAMVFVLEVYVTTKKALKDVWSKHGNSEG